MARVYGKLYIKLWILLYAPIVSVCFFQVLEEKWLMFSALYVQSVFLYVQSDFSFSFIEIW